MKMKRPARVNIGFDRDRAALSKTAHDIVPAPTIIGIDDDQSIDEAWPPMASPADYGDGIYHLFVVDDSMPFLESYKPRGKEFIYCDPPYPKSTRRSQRDLYNFEMTDQQHEGLLTTLLSMEAHIAISSYWSELYADMLTGWRMIRFQVQTRGGKPGDEVLWMNYPETTALHDYRFLGENFRQREVINKRKRRWVSRLQRMNESERRAMLAAIDEVFPAGNIAKTGDRI